MKQASLRLRCKTLKRRFTSGWPLPSCDRNFLVGQGIVQCKGKIASQLSQVFVAIDPGSKLKGYRAGAEVGYVNLWRWFFCHTRISIGSTFQQINHALGIGAPGHIDGDFDRALAIRKGPVSHLTRDERSVRHDDFPNRPRCELRWPGCRCG